MKSHSTTTDLLLAIILLVASPTLAAPKSCIQSVQKANPNSSLVNEPFLKDMQTNLPQLTASFRQLWKSGILSQEMIDFFSDNLGAINFINLTPALALEYAFGNRLALQLSQINFRLTSAPNSPSSPFLFFGNDFKLDQLAQDLRQSGRWTKSKSILITDAPVLSNHFNPLLTLAHEVAHAAFLDFFEKNLTLLHSRYPEFISKDLNDNFVVDSDFFAYLNERFAHEIEIELLRAIHDNPPFYVGNNHENEFYRDYKRSRRESPQIYREVSRLIFKFYNILPDRFLSMESKSLEDLLGLKIPFIPAKD